MADRFYGVDGSVLSSPLTSGYAAALIRMDGTGYFAKGNIKWGVNGDADFAGGKLKIGADGSLSLGIGIKIEGGDGNQTLGSVLDYLIKLSALLVPVDENGDTVAMSDENFNAKVKKIKANYPLYSVGTVAAFGTGTGSGGGTAAGDMLLDWATYSGDKSNWHLSAGLGYDLYNRLNSISAVNPHALTFGSKSYDGSAPITLTAADLGALTAHQDISHLLSKTDAARLYQPKGNYLTAITKAMVEAALTGNITTHSHSQYLTSTALAGYATQQWVSQQGYLKAGDITEVDLAGYATESWVNSQGFLKSVSWGAVGSKPTLLERKDIYCHLTSIYDLRWNFGTYDRNDYPAGEYYPEYPSPYGAYLSLVKLGSNSAAIIAIDSDYFGDDGHMYINTRKAGQSHTQFDGWRKVAYMTDLPTSPAWSAITGKPSTLSGYGITDAYTKTEADGRYLPLSGGTLTGKLILANGYDSKIVLNNTDDEDYWSLIEFQQKGVQYGTLGTRGSTALRWNEHTLWHTGNDGSGSGLDADMLDGVHASGLLTALSSNATTNLSLTVGGTTKTVTNLYAYGLRHTTETYTGQTVAEAKAALLNNIKGSVFGNVHVCGGDLIAHWDDDTHVCEAGSVYTVLNVTPGYNGRDYGQYMLFGYGTGNPKIVGRSQNKWTAMRTLAFFGDITWGNLKDKPTTLSGYGITNAYTKSEIDTKLTNGSVTKVGTATVGAANRPIYLSNGVPTAGTYTFGNASGNAALNNGTVNTNLNADMWDGYHMLRNTNPSGATAQLGDIPWWLALKSAGKPLFDDPEFVNGVNGVGRYNNKGTDAVTVTRIADDRDSGNSSGYILKIETTGAANPGLGGFVQSFQSAANNVFVQIFRAKIPEGFSVMNAENSMGSGYNSYWLTTRAGTGKWEWYVRVTLCGASGNFSSGGYVYLNGSGAGTVTWYLSYCNCINLSKGQYDGLRTKYADSASAAAKLASARTINGTAFDGTANITTAKWGTARTITIADATAAHSGTAVSVDGSANATLKLPTTITATLDGNASTATKLADNTAFTAWGQTFFTGGKPKAISGSLTSVANITMSGRINIGNGGAYLEYDAENDCLRSNKAIVSDETVSAYGTGTASGTGGGSADMLLSWDNYTADRANWHLSAGLGYDLYRRLNSLTTVDKATEAAGLYTGGASDHDVNGLTGSSKLRFYTCLPPSAPNLPSIVPISSAWAQALIDIPLHLNGGETTSQLFFSYPGPIAYRPHLDAAWRTLLDSASYAATLDGTYVRRDGGNGVTGRVYLDAARTVYIWYDASAGVVRCNKQIVY